MTLMKKLCFLALIAAILIGFVPCMQNDADAAHASVILPGDDCNHEFVGGICMNCFDLDPDYRHPCLDGHDFNESGACRNCSIYDPNFFDICTDGHDLDASGQCKDCRYFEEAIPSANQQNATVANESTSVLTVVLIVAIGLMLVGIAVMIYLILKMKK